ncbi:MAG: hypothetical protein ABIE74_08005 [Pseudomonadota bacterium]
MGKIKLEIANKDERGEIVDLIENEIINAVTLITFKKNAVRANHYHKKTTQWNYLVSGRIKFVTQLHGGAVEEHIMEVGELTCSVPNESHALLALEDSKVMVFTKGPRAGKEYESDTYRLKTPLL